ncbi:hypothetical protein OUZ56_002968 [Daphnia magna]|uniref:Uncharacterized protein n=1 Tax=Daphnia magna TaxID=35525 RepID=A0ABR0A7B3_9CRUS|nr:hypothetical protein OUZ56_002968 [Daphnia magna]
MNGLHSLRVVTLEKCSTNGGIDSTAYQHEHDLITADRTPDRINELSTGKDMADTTKGSTSKE